MQEKLVDRATAVLAKEKRFDWKCRGYYSSLHNTVMTNGTLHGAVDHNNPYYDKFAGYPYYSAPTQSLLQKWLREIHKLHLSVVYSHDHNKYSVAGFDQFHGDELKKRNPRSEGRFPYPYKSNFKQHYWKYETFEEALEVGLFEALNLLP